MAVELQSIQAFGRGEAYLVQDHLPSTHHIGTRPDATKPPPLPHVAAYPQLLPLVIKMRASPQRPGPNGSRVVKKRSSIPRLGDRLLTIFAHDAVPYESTSHTESEASATLTSSNLNRLAKSAHFNNDFVLADTSSICSDEDIILIGTPDRSTNSESSSRFSFQSGTPRGDETPPTTLTGDDSYFSSDGETTLNLSSSTPVNDESFLSSKSTSSSIYRPKEMDSVQSSIAIIGRQSPISIIYSETEGSAHSSRHITHQSIDNPPESFESGIVPGSELTPNTELLRGIVKGFLAPVKAKTISSSITEPEQPLTSDPKTPNRVRPFWEPQRIFEFYIKGAIKPEKATETAKRNGYPDVIPIINEIEALKRANPSLHISDIITKAANEGSLGVIPWSTDISAATAQQGQYNTKHHDFTLKLAAYSAQDSSTDFANPLHIFVDMSNIHIGFCNSWKISQNIPVDHRIRAPAFNFKVLASIMERGRACKKKVLASSVASHVLSRTQWPQHFIDAEQQGYKTSILSRVQKVSPIKVGRRRKTSPQGPGVAHLANAITSGDESAEDATKTSYGTRNGEQGVDEILHLNMMNSILDDMREPGTMILATGDAAQAEFSDGFLEYATRALSSGWKLELVTWKRTISSAWMDPVFRNKFEDRFRIIYLDDFLEELNADLCPSLA